METKSQPTILGPSLVKQAISDPNFYKMMPEFLTIQKKLETMKINLHSGQGCSACKLRRASNSVNSDFVALASSLSPERGEALKKYFGVSRLISTHQKPGTYETVTKEI